MRAKPSLTLNSILPPLLSWCEGQLLACRIPLLFLGHIILFTVSFLLAFALRFDFAIGPATLHIFWMTLPIVLAVKLATFYLTGHFHGWWRYVTFADFTGLVRACLASTLLIAFIDYYFLPWQIPRVVLILDGLLTGLVLAALRASWRVVREALWPLLIHKDFRAALMIGADDQSGILAHQIHAHPQLNYRIVGFLDDDSHSRRRQMGGIRILGTPDDLTSIAAVRGVKEILVIAGALSGQRLSALMETCSRAELNLKIIPPTMDHLNGDNRIPIRGIEISDLLGRDPVELDTQTIGGLIEDHRILVSGAGGSIGAEICRQVCRFHPREIVLLGRGENRIFAIERELANGRGAAVELHAVIGSVTDQARMREVFERFRPQVVFHAAAHKHVPLMEANVGEAVKNNVLGTQRVADLADEYDVHTFVLISTDKAVNPTSVMGATKQLAERYVHGMSQQSSTRFVVTRFGNVLGSAGSVVPIFQDQIRCGPITVTDPRMTRYFMTIPEASRLVLEAAAMGKGGEIIVLDMGRPHKIVDLARDLVRLSGLPEDSIEIVYTGIRPGEKLFEEICLRDEHTLPTAHPKLFAAYHGPFTMDETRAAIDELTLPIGGPPAAIRNKLREIIAEYAPEAERGATCDRPAGTR